MAFSKDPGLKLNIYSGQRPTAAKVLPAGPTGFKNTGGGSGSGGGGIAIVAVVLAAVFLLK
ncbi:hypothetical protein [Nannocystis pusilla]|uniref:Uncharacterized protein n=1 Tax=Nannocystis pusilla TaxID=889268 RepID=A0ABS7U493_9BACT|nr:hypothetical protein [Nannocystis pusilla]MBZ5715278.1 hypothetical protein [Nannocystis pusilla]